MIDGLYKLINDNEIIKTEIEDFKVRLYQPEELTQLLQQTGFRTVNILKAFDRTATYDDTDEVIVDECKK